MVKLKKRESFLWWFDSGGRQVRVNSPGLPNHQRILFSLLTLSYERVIAKEGLLAVDDCLVTLF
jgi:hypothetical protein